MISKRRLNLKEDLMVIWVSIVIEFERKLWECVGG